MSSRWRHGGDTENKPKPDHMLIRISKRTVDAIPISDRAVIAYDDQLAGFGVRVAPSGALSWFVEYRPGAGGRQVAKKRHTFGSREFTPEQARQTAKELLASIALGNDPAAARKTERDSETFREFAQRYLREEAAAKLKPGTVVNYEIAVRKHANPLIGSMKLKNITTSDVAKIHAKVGLTHPMTANRVMECISSIYRYAAISNVVPFGHNPTKGIRAFREQRRERFLSSDELARLGSAIREAETVGISYDVDMSKPNSKHAPKPENRLIKIDAYTAAALRLLILTGARLREILHLKWDYVDLQRGLLLLPDSKTGRKAIVLNGPAIAIIGELVRQGDYVIASSEENIPKADLKKPWATISKRAGLTGVRLHDLRHTHASVGAGAGMSLHIIGKLLGHKQASTTMRYAHLDFNPLRHASDQIGNSIAAAMNAKARG